MAPTWNTFLQYEAVSQDCVDFKLIYVDMAGDLIAGLLLSQIIYWHLPSKNGGSKLRVRRDGYSWIAKKYDDWYDEVRISGKQARRAIDILEQQGLIETAVFQFAGAPTTHVRIVPEVFIERWEASIPPDRIETLFEDEVEEIPQESPSHNHRKSPKGILENAQRERSSTENTTEITETLQAQDSGASDAPDGAFGAERVPKRYRARSPERREEDAKESAVMEHFRQLTNLQPRGSDIYKLWKDPARELLFMHDWDVGKTCALISQAVNHMNKNKLTYYSIESVMKVALFIMAQGGKSEGQSRPAVKEW